jgi:5-methylcytosine-specific restriction endonuclease McrA
MLRHCLGRCGALINSGSYCPRCRPRNGSTRQWRVLRAQILYRDRYECQLRLPGCTGTANTVDHRVPVLLGGDDSEENLIAACSHCNLAKGANPDR